MAVKFKIKTGDLVQVIVGKDKGKVGEVKSVNRKDSLVMVENVNSYVKHKKQTPGEPGGIETVNKPLHVSNVALYDQASGSRSKVGFKILENGNKSRVYKKTGELVEEPTRK